MTVYRRTSPRLDKRFSVGRKNGSDRSTISRASGAWASNAWATAARAASRRRVWGMSRGSNHVPSPIENTAFRCGHLTWPSHVARDRVRVMGPESQGYEVGTCPAARGVLQELSHQPYIPAKYRAAPSGPGLLKCFPVVHTLAPNGCITHSFCVSPDVGVR